MALTDLFRGDTQRSIPIWLPIVAALLLAARILVPAREVVTTPGPREFVQWRPLAQAPALAAASRKPILYEFSAAWCGPCQQMERDVFRDPDLAAKINDAFIPVRVIDRQQEDGVNPPQVQELQSRYSVRAFPTLIIADATGNEAQRMEGYGGVEAFERFVNR